MAQHKSNAELIFVCKCGILAAGVLAVSCVGGLFSAADSLVVAGILCVFESHKIHGIRYRVSAGGWQAGVAAVGGAMWYSVEGVLFASIAAVT